MTATAAQIAQVRRMVVEPTTATYTDVAIQAYIEAYPLLDELGQAPYTWTGTQPPVKVSNSAWIPTYDMSAAAADIWDEKAAILAAKFDFSADGASYTRSQAYEQASKRARYWRARRHPVTMTMVSWPHTTDTEQV